MNERPSPDSYRRSVCNYLEKYKTLLYIKKAVRKINADGLAKTALQSLLYNKNTFIYRLVHFNSSIGNCAAGAGLCMWKH